jgi:hypothetical protein
MWAAGSLERVAAVKQVTEIQKCLVDEAVFLRGRIVASYSQVEFLLADMSVKLDLKFPHPVKERIKAVKRIAERNGYEVYRDDLDRVCDQLLRYEELRHFMAHGFMSLTTDEKNNHRFEFRLYRHEREGKFTLDIRQTTVEHLRQAVGDITEYVSNALALFQRIYRVKEVETKP